MRVLHVCSTLGPRLGGPSKAAFEMCRALARKGLHVELYATNLDERGRWSPIARPRVLDVAIDRVISQDGVDVNYFPVRWPSRLAFAPDMARSIKGSVRQFDVVHVHSLFQYPSHIACREARRSDIPYILRPHGTLDPYLRKRHPIRKHVWTWLFERSDLDNAARIHYTSEEERLAALPVGIKAPGAVIPLGVDTAEFDELPPRGSFRRQYPQLATSQLIVFLGRLSPQKGLDILVESFPLVLARHPNAHLVIAGPDDDGLEGVLRRHLKRSGLAGKVTFTGMLAGQEKLALLADTDVWVLPSRMENFGMAVVEAMACSLPVVLSDRVQIHKQVSDAQAGLVVPLDSSPLADAISHLLEDETLRQSLGSRARVLVHTSFRWETVADSLVALYESVCRPKPSRVAEDTPVVSQGHEG